MTEAPTTPVSLELSTEDLRLLATTLHWAIFQFGYRPNDCSQEQIENLAARIVFRTVQIEQDMELEAPARRDYVNIFYNPNDPHKPFRVLIFARGQANALRVGTLAEAAAACHQHGLPVITNDSEMQAALAGHGITASIFHTADDDHC
jgi:hypothetical protein